MTICVINPNSSQHVTDGVDRAIEPMRRYSPVPIKARTLTKGPHGIEPQAHVDGMVLPMLAHCAALEHKARAFVVACYSDPGLAALREQSGRPVLGIAEASILMAMTLGQRFRSVSTLSKSIPRHVRCLGAMDRLTDKARTFDRLKAVATRPRDKASAVIFGCARMTDFRMASETFLGVPVIEPRQAATAMAIRRFALQTT